MSEHQESLKQVVARIEASFVKIKSYSEQADQFRISAGKQLVELQARIETGEAGKSVKWWAWYAEHFKNRTRRDAQKVMALARADDPDAAAEKERTKNREAKAAQRRRVASGAPQPEDTSDSQPRWTEEDYAAQIVRDVEREIANLDGEVADLDLLRELILQKLTFAFKGGESAEESAEARKAAYGEMERAEKAAAASPSPEPAPAKKRGRPPGSKNKPKEAAPAPEPEESPKPAPTGNDVDTEATAEARKWLLPRPSQRRRRTTAAFPGFCGAIRPSSRCNHEHRTLYGHATCRTPHARREIRLLLILS
jgi:hypothetical protein